VQNCLIAKQIHLSNPLQSTNKMKYLLPFLLLLLASSCVQQNKLIYMHGAVNDTLVNPAYMPVAGYRIQKQDILYIKVMNLEKQIEEIAGTTQQYSTAQMFSTESGAMVHGYMVNDSGYVNIPVLGLVKIEGETLPLAEKAIQERAGLFFKEAMVSIKILNFRYTILGEVRRPGVYRHYNHQLTVLEALGMAGDLTEYGNRGSVLVVRPEQEKNITYRVNLSDKNVLASPAYYVQPNDIIVVEPRRSKATRLNFPVASLAFGVISTTLLLISFFTR
jgi:polysaccharide biosynthesis/export protein